ncbi:hypothetical protein CK203_102451 [Vitis vinifera]|uniref:Major facilitator superfamily (MFS) profile domain-containing protein n=1 Tax=Vitis vinifera TaxID=29760 RepID=A0A438CIN1_VITVI|nr:hypothetical protein CK203_102451 [Vitis vinifera]
MAGQQFWGIPGWRCAFIMMATLSSLIGFLVFQYVVDPRRTINITHDSGENSDRNSLLDKSKASSVSVWLESWTATKAVIKVQTFQIIVLQGVVGSLPWTAMVFFTMWFELIGFDHNSSAALLSVFAIGCAMGSLLGGLIADRMSQIYPHSGRIMCAQFSALMGIPFSWFLLTVIPHCKCSHVCGGCPVKHRTMIYAFDRAFEGSFSSFAAPMVGILSEKMFGYDPKTVDPVSGSAQAAFALSRGLLSMMAVPFGLCCLFYTPLYVVFRRDRENARISSLKEEEMM